MNFDFYTKIKTQPTTANCDIFDIAGGGDLFRDGLYVGHYAVGGMEAFIPVIAPLEKFGAICFLTDESHKEKGVEFMQACALRILSSVKPDLCKFVLYDGVNLGGGLIALSGLDSRIKGDKILTAPAELNRALERLSDRAITVIQNVLGSKYADSSLVEYNHAAGDASEPYHFLFIKDYPEGLSAEQCRLIEQIIKSGPKAGIFTFLSFSPNHLDTSYNNAGAKDVLKYTANIIPYYENTYIWDNIPNAEVYNFYPFNIADKLPSPDFVNALYSKISDALDKAENVTLDITAEMNRTEMWTGDASTGIQVPVGKQNISTLQYFRLGDEVNHALIGGATGYGKSVLLHNIICNVAWRYSPEQVQMILLDYKEGTEFKIYENLPHARVLSIQSEREYGVSVFKFIEEEIRRRGDAFKAAGTQDISSYNRLSGHTMPRLLLIIDEFQKLLDGDSKTTAFISGCLEDVGRRGRSFGINLILSTQSLINVNISGLQQSLGLRIVLHLNTQFDCDRFLSNNNYVPYTTLSRPGQAVYNARAGLTEGNVLFQTAFMSREEMSKIIDKIHYKALEQYDGRPAPYHRFFYDGSSSAEITTNNELSRFTQPNDKFCTVFLGEPVALKESHVSFKIGRQNSSNILIVGGDADSAFSIMTYMTMQILNQSASDVRIFIADKTNFDSKYHESLSKVFSPWSDKIKVTGWDDDISEFIDSLHQEMTQRLTRRQPGSRVIFVINNIYDIRCLRKSGYTGSAYARKLSEILKDGPSVGIHTCVYAPTFGNFTQIFEAREILPEFGIKIELGGGNGFRIFSGAASQEKSQLRDQSTYLANLQIGDSEEIIKFKVYRNNID